MDKNALKKQGATIGENVYLTLRSNIIELNIKPGQTISIKDICEQLSVSRSPVRDALIKLEKEGLIESMPQKGTMISKIDISRVLEERFLRSCLEEKVLELFVDMHTEQDIQQLYQLLEKQKESSRKKDIRESLQYDDAFHKVFFTATEKNLCWQTILNTSGHYRRIRLLTDNDPNILSHVIKQHEQMIHFIEKKDTKNLIDTLKLHLTKIEREEADLLNQYPDLFSVAMKVIKEEQNFLEQDFLELLH